MPENQRIEKISLGNKTIEIVMGDLFRGNEENQAIVIPSDRHFSQFVAGGLKAALVYEHGGGSILEKIARNAEKTRSALKKTGKGGGPFKLGYAIAVPGEELPGKPLVIQVVSEDSKRENEVHDDFLERITTPAVVGALGKAAATRRIKTVSFPLLGGGAMSVDEHTLPFTAGFGGSAYTATLVYSFLEGIKTHFNSVKESKIEKVRLVLQTPREFEVAVKMLDFFKKHIAENK